jgi:hypothetical protein
MARIIAVAACSAAGWACAPSVNWEGRWVGNRQVEVLPGADPVVAHTWGRVELIVRGGRFELSDGGIPMAGYLKPSGSEAVLEVRTAFGRELRSLPPVERDAFPNPVLQVRSDGNLLYLNPARDALGQGVLLISEAQP